MKCISLIKGVGLVLLAFSAMGATSAHAAKWELRKHSCLLVGPKVICGRFRAFPLLIAPQSAPTRTDRSGALLATNGTARRGRLLPSWLIPARRMVTFEAYPASPQPPVGQWEPTEPKKAGKVLVSHWWRASKKKYGKPYRRRTPRSVRTLNSWACPVQEKVDSVLPPGNTSERVAKKRAPHSHRNGMGKNGHCSLRLKILATAKMVSCWVFRASKPACA